MADGFRNEVPRGRPERLNREQAESIIVMWALSIDERDCDACAGEGEWVERDPNWGRIIDRRTCTHCEGDGVQKRPHRTDIEDATELLLSKIRQTAPTPDQRS